MDIDYGLRPPPKPDYDQIIPDVVLPDQVMVRRLVTLEVRHAKLIDAWSVCNSDISKAVRSLNETVANLKDCIATLSERLERLENERGRVSKPGES